MEHGERRTYPRANLKWRVVAEVNDKVMEGVTQDISAGGAYVRCAKPKKLNEVFNMVIHAPDRSLQVTAEVVWSNIYGPDDEINPRGMGVSFLGISDEDRQFISRAVNEEIAKIVPPERSKSVVIGSEKSSQ